jgi:hypothetical protein
MRPLQVASTIHFQKYKKGTTDAKKYDADLSTTYSLKHPESFYRLCVKVILWKKIAFVINVSALY